MKLNTKTLLVYYNSSAHAMIRDKGYESIVDCPIGKDTDYCLLKIHGRE